MITLRAYLTKLSPDEQAAYALRAGTTIGYLRKAMSKGQRFDGALARRLDEESNGEVSRHDLRPDVFGDAPTAVPRKEAA
ncbi:helix-turn-helix domain-containing protein [Luteimonas sp. XNQY3]|nr:helix-turn-helix domain-containing protein [Luteimonas sp. XNQY3]MCD9005187.1 helix-turn-helix domain-containing protein [Luteimonas sp. XNQY3]